MESKSFCYWLQGLFELSDPKTLDEKQVELIKKHLNMVFYHEIDPSYPKEQQKILNEIHNGKKEASIQDNVDFFNEKLPTLLEDPKYANKFVAIYNKDIKFICNTHNEALELLDSLNEKPANCIIQQVTDKLPKHTLVYTKPTHPFIVPKYKDHSETLLRC